MVQVKIIIKTVGWVSFDSFTAENSNFLLSAILLLKLLKYNCREGGFINVTG